MDRRARWLAYNGAAAGAGWGIGAGFYGPAWSTRLLTACAAQPVGITTTTAVFAAAAVAWRISGTRSARSAVAIVVPSVLAPLARPTAAFAAAAWANGLAPSISAALRRYGTWPHAVTPLAVAIAAAGLAWHLLGRRSRAWSAPMAWLARIPTATALLALALYTSGATHH